MRLLDEFVDLCLAVTNAGLETLYQPFENDQFPTTFGWNDFEALIVQIRAEDLFFSSFQLAVSASAPMRNVATNARKTVG